MKSTLINVFFTLLSLMLVCTVYSQDNIPYVIGNIYTIESKILKENREYIIEIPDSYNASKHDYPLLVILDGENSYHSYSGIIKHMTSARQIPEMIIVAIKNVDRVRDYTPTKFLTNLNGSDGTDNHKTSGGSSKFLNFLEKELLPKIESNYRTNSFRTLVGISHGGLLVGSSFLSEETSFTGFVSMDPSFWWDNQFIVNQLKQININQIKNKRFYLSTADKFENFERLQHVYQNNLNAQERFNSELKNKGFSPRNIKFDYFQEENHWTTALVGLYNGMQFIFKDIRMKNIQNQSLAAIIEYYKSNYNGAFFPPENDINRMGYTFIKTDPLLAISFFELNVKNYPNSWNAYDSLAEAFLAADNKAQALTNYEKSLLLNPNNENAKKMIKKLTE